MFDLAIRGGTIVTATASLRADVAIDGEQIAAVGQSLRGRTEIAADGLLVLPGAIDGHVHMRTERPHFVYDDTFTTGTAAALFGGVTTIIDQAQVEPHTDLQTGVANRLRDAHNACLTDYALHINIRESHRRHLEAIAPLVTEGFTSFKFFMAYETYALPDDYMYAAMRRVAAAGGLSIVHAENDAVINELLRENETRGPVNPRSNAAARPPELEGQAVHTALVLARLADADCLIFHLTAIDSVRELRLAQARGQVAFGEACLAHLLLDVEALDDPVVGSGLDTSPPLRSEEHRQTLWEAVQSRVIDIISTDHGPRNRQTLEDGTLWTPPGTSGIEVRVPLVYSYGVRQGRLDLNRWVDACCTRPAEVFGLPNKGHLLPGYDADILLFDPNREMTLSASALHSNINHSTYEDVGVRGYPVTTICRGRVVMSDGQLHVDPGYGKLIRRVPRHRSR